jgi:dTDP-4-dehydrorhamnose 3,5-epimerase-like enzyme
MGRALRGADPAGRGALMRFAPTPIPGCWVIEPEEEADESGTLRGMHWQEKPH